MGSGCQNSKATGNAAYHPPNFPVLGKPFGTMRPAEARAAIHSASSSFLRRTAVGGVLPDQAIGQARMSSGQRRHPCISGSARPCRGQFGHFGQREDEQFAVFADDGDMIASDGEAEFGLVRRLDVHDLLALAGVGRRFGFRHDKAVALVAEHQQLAVRVVDKGGDDVLIVFQVDHDADRLAVAAPAGQAVGAEHEEFAAGGEHQNLVCRVGRERQFELVALLEGQRRIVGDMALHGAQPAFFQFWFYL